MDQAPLQLDREVVKGENGERGGDGWLFEEGDLIEERLLFEEIR